MLAVDTNHEWEELFKKYVQNKCSNAELDTLIQQLDEQYLSRKSFDELLQLTNCDAPLSQEIFRDKVLRITSAVEEKLFPQIQSNAIEETRPKQLRARSFSWYWAAAILLCCFSFSGLYLFYKMDHTPEVNISNRDTLIAQKKVFITLSNGQAVDLESLELGESIKEVGYLIQRNIAGAYVYLKDPNQPENSLTNAAILANRIDIPSGKQAQFILPDGSSVWLNTQSSLTYPLNFSSKERLVELKGEGYFEVAKDPRRPFRVYSALEDREWQLLEVYGTRFNVCAYESNEAIQTHLLEGSVSISLAAADKVPDPSTMRMLKPMEQALVRHGDINITRAEAEDPTSWVKGYFHFNETSLESILGRISRWYDVEFIYSKDMINLSYSGTLPKSLPLKRVLALLEINNKVQFVMEGRRVRVLN